MPDEFDDPLAEDANLKSAVRRVLGGQQVPPSLRARVEAALKDAQAEEQTPLRIPFRRNPLFSLAATAVLLIGVGVVAWRVLSVGGLGPTLPAAPPLPDSFAQALVVRHDLCAAAPDHHVLKGVPDDDFRLMSQKLREQLGFPALAAAAGDGWVFRGASPRCKVGKVRSAHLLFAKAGESLSIFSVAVSSEKWPDGHVPVEGDRFVNREGTHPIVSWVHEGVVFSVVAVKAGGTMDVDEIQPIADRLQTAVIASDGGESITVASR